MAHLFFALEEQHWHAVLTFTCLHVTDDLLSHAKICFYQHLPAYALVDETLPDKVKVVGFFFFSVS